MTTHPSFVPFAIGYLVLSFHGTSSASYWPVIASIHACSQSSKLLYCYFYLVYLQLFCAFLYLYENKRITHFILNLFMLGKWLIFPGQNSGIWFSHVCLNFLCALYSRQFYSVDNFISIWYAH